MLKRIARTCLLGAALAACATLAAPVALAQTDSTSSMPTQDRLIPIPVKAVRGDMEFNGTQIVLLDGKQRQLAPGVRIYGPDNMLKLASSLKGTAKTKYLFEENTGLLQNIWILTPREIATPDPKPATN
jgi:hypothetical protein